jgi:hypothetical protein
MSNRFQDRLRRRQSGLFADPVDIWTWGGVLVEVAQFLADAMDNDVNTPIVGSRLEGYNGQTWDRLRSGQYAPEDDLTGWLDTLPFAQYNATPPTLTDTEAVVLQCDPDGSLKVSAHGPDAIGDAPTQPPLIIAGVDYNTGNVVQIPVHIIASGYGGGFGTYSNVTTDLESFREDFPTLARDSGLGSDMAGTCTFAAGSDHVTGVLTTFTTDITTYDSYVRLTGHALSVAGKIASVEDDTHLTLTAPYGGANGSGVGIVSLWKETIGAGGSIVVAASELTILSGTTNGSKTYVQHGSYCAPYAMSARIKLSQRIIDQEAFWGIIDDVTTPVFRANVVFSGTDNTLVTLRTGNASAYEESTVALPGGLTTAAYVRYRIVANSDGVTLYANDLLVCRNRLHIPAPLYHDIPLTVGWRNTGAPATTSTLYIDTCNVVNNDVVEVESQVTNNPAPVQIMTFDASGTPLLPGASSTGGLKTTETGRSPSDDDSNCVFTMCERLMTTATYGPLLWKNWGANTAALVKAGSVNVKAVRASNANAAIRYFQLHNKATLPLANEVPVYSFPVFTGVPLVVDEAFFVGSGANFSLGLGWAWSTTQATFTDAATVGEHSSHGHYMG